MIRLASRSLKPCPVRCVVQPTPPLAPASPPAPASSTAPDELIVEKQWAAGGGSGPWVGEDFGWWVGRAHSRDGHGKWTVDWYTSHIDDTVTVSYGDRDGDQSYMTDDQVQQSVVQGQCTHVAYPPPEFAVSGSPSGQGIRAAGQARKKRLGRT